MSGKTLLKAMSFVDEKYIDEAENKTIRKSHSQWMRLLPLAACLCIVLLGFFSRNRWRISAESSSQHNESVHDFIENWDNTDLEVQSNQNSSAEAEEVPSVILRVESWNKNGFVGTVTALTDTDIFDVGMTLNVIVEEDAWIQIQKEDALICADSDEAKSIYREGSLVQVQFVYYDKETGTIYVNVLSPAE